MHIMENRAHSKTSNNSKYLDHVYCHTSEGKTYMRANNNNNTNSGGAGGAAAAGSDVLALLKENKQLKAMLLLHLDLIQEQSDQIIAKDKKLGRQIEELDALRAKCTELEAEVQNLQKQVQRQMKRSAPAVVEPTSVPIPPLAKIQCKSEDEQKPNIIGECNGKLISKIILHRVSLPKREITPSPPSSTTTSDTASEADEVASKKHPTESEQDDDEEDEDREGEPDEKEEQAEELDEEDADGEADIQASVDADADGDEGDHEGGHETDNSSEDSNDTRSLEHSKDQERHQSSDHESLIRSLSVPRGAKPSLITMPISAVPPLQLCATPPLSRGKDMPLMFWHAPELNSDDSASCDSTVDTEQRSISRTPPSFRIKAPKERKKKENRRVNNSRLRNHLRNHVNNTRRSDYLMTKEMYCTREWEDEEFLFENELVNDETNPLLEDTPTLEIPKWTEHENETTFPQCMEGFEDLSDDTFLKRHAKLETDERRRKKWDFQQIREQRRIERLKRRHCKDEIQPQPEVQVLLTYYPQPDSIESIQFTEELPVQAFGEVIPKIRMHGDFGLPWIEATDNLDTLLPIRYSTRTTLVSVLANGRFNPTSAQAQNQLMNSTYVYQKKRKRAQTSTVATITRQRRAAAAAAAAQLSATAAAEATATSTTLVPTSISHYLASAFPSVGIPASFF